MYSRRNPHCSYVKLVAYLKFHNYFLRSNAFDKSLDDGVLIEGILKAYFPQYYDVFRIRNHNFHAELFKIHLSTYL